MYTDRSERERAPVVTDDRYVHHVRIESLRHLSHLTYYVSRGGRSIAVQLHGATVLGQRNQAAVSPRVYIPRDRIEPDATEWNLLCLATHALAAWHRCQLARYCYEELIVACRAYRGTHADVLRTVAQTMRGRHGADWWADDRAMRIATETLRKFGVAV